MSDLVDEFGSGAAVPSPTTAVEALPAQLPPIDGATPPVTAHHPVPVEGAGVFELAGDDFEQVVFCNHPPSGLRAIIAIHSTALGPAMGGTRFYPYSAEQDALVDVLRLARGMTYKQAAAGIDYGGGKGVIIGDPATKSEAMIRAYGRFVDSLGGRYLTAEDVGTSQADMDLIRRETRHVTGVSPSLGGSGDPSPATAWGVYWAMKAVAERLWGSDSLADRHVVVSGVGKVGSALVGHLAAEGARLTVADVDARASRRVVEQHGAALAAPGQAHAIACDIFSPCALGAVLDERTIPQLACAAVVGAANNQLATAADGDRIAQAGVLYAPDYVVNAGGVINISEEPAGYDRDRAYHRIRGLGATVHRVLDLAEADGTSTAEAADRYAEARLESVGRLTLIRRPDH